MAKNSAGAEMQQQPPELYGYYATYTRKGTAGYTVVPHPVTCPDPYDDETKEAYIQRKEDGLVNIGGPRAVSVPEPIILRSGGRLECDTCDAWYSSDNAHKMLLHMAKKPGHKVRV